MEVEEEFDVAAGECGGEFGDEVPLCGAAGDNGIERLERCGEIHFAVGGGEDDEGAARLCGLVCEAFDVEIADGVGVGFGVAGAGDGLRGPVDEDAVGGVGEPCLLGAEGLGFGGKFGEGSRESEFDGVEINGQIARARDGFDAQCEGVLAGGEIEKGIEIEAIPRRGGGRERLGEGLARSGDFENKRGGGLGAEQDADAIGLGARGDDGPGEGFIVRGPAGHRRFAVANGDERLEGYGLMGVDGHERIGAIIEEVRVGLEVGRHTASFETHGVEKVEE